MKGTNNKVVDLVKLKKAIKSKQRKIVFGNNIAGEFTSDADKKVNKMARILISKARRILKTKLDLPDIWFENNFWEGRQIKEARKMVVNKPVEFWLAVLNWCLTSSDSYAQKVRNLKPLIKYSNYYLEEKRQKDKELDREKAMKEKVKKWS